MQKTIIFNHCRVIKLKRFIYLKSFLFDMKDLIFAIPTYRYNEAHICAQVYAENFKKFQHEIPIIVFDDSSPPNSNTLIDNLKSVANEFPNQAFYYFGFEEKKEYLEKLVVRFDSDVPRNLLRPSCGGNHNWVFLYTLGKFQLTIDEDISPYGLITNSTKVKKDDNLVLSGKFFNSKPKNSHEVEFDVITEYEKYLGKTSGEILLQNPAIITGKHLRDSLVHLEFNTTNAELKNNTVHAVPGTIDKNSRVYVVQSFLTGDVDLDSKDIVAEFVKTGNSEVLKGFVPKKYYANHFKPCLLDYDYKATGALLGLDNRDGFMFFIPTPLRIDDFLFRLYTQKDGVDVAYCNAIQTHNRLLSRRNLINDFFNEEMSFVLKKALNQNFKIEGLVTTIPSGYEFENNDIEKVAEEVSNLLSVTESKNSRAYQVFRQEVTALGVNNKSEFHSKIRNILDQEYKITYDSTKIWDNLVNFASENPLKARRIMPE